MICPYLQNTQQDFLEVMYNHKSICESITQENSGVAKALFEKKVSAMAQMKGEPISDEHTRTLLENLNMALYDYFLFHQHLSFSECCHENREKIKGAAGEEKTVECGFSIIDSYAGCLEKTHVSYTHIKNACDYIQAHLNENLSLNKVSAAIFLSASHLCYIFKTLVGATFCDYVRQQRIERARTLLSLENSSIEDIAAECGFRSAAYFSTVFKSEMNMTPSAFRQAVLENQELAEPGFERKQVG